ncbi:MAG: putative Ubiquinone/menaquinone biosynthesis methyltransferase UbiE [Candidatus Nitrospira kreftii]|uniref:Putative Ubiquinone/menaquinone biosynthesis methyltransferase UbiE n=1 Tax=Candidatus Nitrospira kreftii TaxID=2652173 RepID=A0A7S8FGT1_9BACT|nr:MAG: putative Ubiquinone/menaquinone biosynthesis methyltransferase UbiE [Candidatus Nitrospira kreftii]
MASLSPEQVIEGQRQDWNRVADGWEKWDCFFDEQMAFLNHRLVGDARLRAGLRVLDLGSGTGYPAILAAQTVGARGSVVGIDLAQQMLDAAGRKVASLQLSNLTFRAGDVTTLPFETASFDAVTTRFCLMFLPDIPKAVAEIARILKPDTWMAAAVWSTPEKNPYLKIPIDIIKQFIELPPPDPAAPGIFRLAMPGELAAMLHQAGFIDISEQEFLGDVRFAEGGEYFSSLMDIAAPIQNLWEKLNPTQQTEARQRIIDTAGQYRNESGIALPIAVRMVAARKPG